MRLPAEITFPLSVSVFIIAFFGFSANAQHHDFFVATDGDDSNPGTIDSPFRTIKKGLEVAVGGDSVLLRGGVYKEAVQFPRDGTLGGKPGGCIHLIGYKNEEITIDGTGIQLPGPYTGLVNANGRKYIVIESLNIINSSGAGVSADNAENVYINYNKFTNTVGPAVQSADGSAIWVIRNTMRDVCLGYGTAIVSLVRSNSFAVDWNDIVGDKYTDLAVDGVYADLGCYQGRMLWNTISGCSGSGVVVRAPSGNATLPFYFSKNRIFDNDENGIVLRIDSLAIVDINFAYSLVYGNRLWGLKIEPSFQGGSEKGKIVNGTFYFNTIAQNGYGLLLKHPNITNTHICNTLSALNANEQMITNLQDGVQGNEFSHNLSFPTNAGGNEAIGKFHVKADPLFNNCANKDFRLSEKSPAVDAGLSIDGYIYDINQVKGPLGKGFDIGCYESPHTADLESVDAKNGSFEVTAALYNPQSDHVEVLIRSNCAQGFEITLWSLKGQLLMATYTVVLPFGDTRVSLEVGHLSSQPLFITVDEGKLRKSRRVAFLDSK